MIPRVYRRRKYPKRRPRKVLNPKPLPDQNVMVEFLRPDGRKYVRLMGGAAYRKLVGNAKGGRTTAARGTQHKWTSETARKAVNKLWRTRMRKVRGIRIGVPAKRRDPINHKELRIRYGSRISAGLVGNEAVWYSYVFENWRADTIGGAHQGTTRVLTERTALRKLGHLPSPYRPVPHRVITRIKMINGKTVAFKEES